jgi:hypothetical protein
MRTRSGWARKAAKIELSKRRERSSRVKMDGKVELNREEKKERSS